jgi:lipopolysaccharide transport protein LptA/LPS export ABC transporter protein LptC
MASTTTFPPALERPRQIAFGPPEEADRARDFARARRHTQIVRILRWVLPVCAAGVVAIYVGTVLQTIGWVQQLPSVELPQIIPENLTMDNPRYQGFNGDGGSYVVMADTAVQDLSDTSTIKLNGVTGDLTDANKVKTNLKATRGLYSTKSEQLELLDGIDIVSDNGMRVHMSRATIITKENVVVTKEPVTVEMPTGSIRSNQMRLRNKTREVTFIDAVVARLVPQQDPARKTPEASNVPLIGAGNGPIDLTANRLDLDDTKKVATFSGKVRAVQGEAALETAALKVHYDQPAPGSATPATAAQGAKISRIVSEVPVVLTRAPDDRVTGNSLDFDAKTEVSLLSGDVIITSGSDRRVTSNAVSIDQRADTILLTGAVVAVQGRNQLQGERLFVERATGRTQLSSPAARGAAPGRISTRFYGEAKPGAPAKHPKEVAAGAVANAAGVFKTDPNAPVDIEADRLDVDDKAHQAVFRGDVRAQQGDFTVRTAQLTAHYTGSAGIAGATGGAAKPQPAQLTRIEARGKVIVTSKDGQRATGDWANFDMHSNKVIVGGDVVLSQAQNVIRGTQLVIDMATGQSTIHEDPGTAWSATAAPDGKDGGIVVGPNTARRPSAIFYPQTKKGAAKKAPPPTMESEPAETEPGSSDGGSWSPTNEDP